MNRLFCLFLAILMIAVLGGCQVNVELRVPSPEGYLSNAEQTAVVRRIYGD